MRGIMLSRMFVWQRSLKMFRDMSAITPASDNNCLHEHVQHACNSFDHPPALTNEINRYLDISLSH